MIYKSEKIIENPLCSVFIFTYNQENLVSQTIESILEQECDYPFEIIILEDCSTDRTKEVCLEYQQKYPEKIIIIANDQNLGMVKNYHEKIYEFARGKYVAQCSGDDYWCNPSKLQKQIQFLEDNPDNSLCHTSVRSLNLDSGIQKEMIKYDLNEGLREYFFENKVAALTACFRLETFKKYCDTIDPLSQNWYSEDYPMWLYFAGHSKIKVIEEVTAVYRVYTGSLSRPKDLDKFLFRIKIRMKFKKFYLDYYKMEQSFCDDVIFQTYMEAQYWAAKAKDIDYCIEIGQYYKEHGFIGLSRFMFLYAKAPSLFPAVSLLQRILLRLNLIKTKKFKNNSYYTRILK